MSLSFAFAEDQWETKWQDKKEYYENPALCTSLKNWGVDSQWYDNCSCNCCFNSIKEQFQVSDPMTHLLRRPSFAPHSRHLFCKAFCCLLLELLRNPPFNCLPHHCR